ncbi:MAG: 16S rRNA (uracil(1498)-N(3))-methyltransferase [Deltaproteobacteria bacterium]|nr:16S rRNA (uracil(1498)-N(3))-methyltransferase [Deltaproteobacteria bacterium]
MNFKVLRNVVIKGQVIEIDQPFDDLNQSFTRVIVPNQGTYKVKIYSSNQAYIIEKIDSIPVDCVFFIGLQRPQSAKRILFTAGSYGVRHLFFFTSENQRDEFLTSSVYRNPEPYLLAGMEQSGNYRLPKVEIVEFDFMVYRLLHESNECVVFDKRGQRTLESLFSAEVFVMGPEKGFSERELKKMNEFRLASLGEHIYRAFQIVEGVCFLKQLKI